MNGLVNRLLLPVLLLASHSLHSQINFTANDTVPPFDGHFRFGANMGAYFPWRDENLADIAAGNPELGIQGAGVDALRPLLSEWFLEYWGYDIRLDAFQHYQKLGIEDNVVFVGYPSPEHQDQTHFCPAGPSQLFANLYEPIWDNGENGTPVNDNNYYALYLYKMVGIYDPYVKYWEIWNEPDFDFTGGSSALPGQAGNWWEHNPDPCGYALHAPIFHYVRLLRISYEVIKYLSPNDYVAIGGIGHPAFLDVVLRNSDNPSDGSVDSLHPNLGGAYFDVLSYHSYPHIDNSVRIWDDNIMGFKYFRHSDRCVDGFLKRQTDLRKVLETRGYDGVTFPKKEWIVTESNIPSMAFGEYLGSPEAQRNYVMKALVASQQNDIRQFHIYQLSDIEPAKKATSEFQMMGLYASIDSIQLYTQKINPVGLAYKTTSMLLKGKRYDAEQTAKLKLPTHVRGGAFRAENGSHVYVLWAATSKDRSEKTNATYAFPSEFNLGTLRKREWNFARASVTTLVDASEIELTGTPIFLLDGKSEDPAEPAKRIFLDCAPNPFSSELTIDLKLPDPMLSTLRVYDMTGRQVTDLFTRESLTEGEHSLKVSGGNLPAGAYYFVFQTLGGRQVGCQVVKK